VASSSVARYQNQARSLTIFFYHTFLNTKDRLVAACSPEEEEVEVYHKLLKKITAGHVRNQLSSGGEVTEGT
jgi:hypothetical protein